MTENTLNLEQITEQITDEVLGTLKSLMTPSRAKSKAPSSKTLDGVVGIIDHTLLKPTATQAQIMALCEEAATYRFASVCVNPTHVKLATQLLHESGIPVCTVIGFPLGANATAVKVYETQQAIQDGATEVDMVINIGALQSGNYQTVYEDIEAVVKTAVAHRILTKVIIETALLTDDEKRVACKLAKAAGADFVKTSTGFSHHGATVEDVQLMRDTVGVEMGVKASGGVRSLADAQAMISAGATRIGASSGVAIAQEVQGEV